MLVNKPKGITSHDVVDAVRKATGVKKVGHAGTLDPNATGLLIVGVGREATRGLGEIAKNMKKVYEAEILLGATSDTDDAEGKIVHTNPAGSKPSRKEVKKIVKSFTGEQMQKPPEYSAIKIRGRKAYQLARQGKKVELEPRKIKIYSIKLLEYTYPVLTIECVVSSGTYIRALARDIGDKAGTGAYLNNLRRTSVGQYKLEDAVEVSDI